MARAQRFVLLMVTQDLKCVSRTINARVIAERINFARSELLPIVEWYINYKMLRYEVYATFESACMRTFAI